MDFLKRKDAVSPVIGVILMVAITVILAAVIAAFVFGMASGVQKTKTVAITARQTGNYFALTYDGGPDDPSVANLSVTLLDNGTQFWYDGAAAQPSHLAIAGSLLGNGKPAVGSGMSSYGATAGQDHVTATATFTDGTSQVLLDTYV